MTFPVVVDSVDERIANGIAFEVGELHDSKDKGGSTYIHSYTTEYVADLANALRMLRLCRGNSGRSVHRLLDSLEWREENKVYPAKKQASFDQLTMNSSGMIVVTTRKASALSRVARDRKLNTNDSPGALLGSKGSPLCTRGIEVLEDARISLKSLYTTHNILAQAAIVVPLETVPLSQVSVDHIMQLIYTAETHYPGIVGRLYLTASSSVFLEHARHALHPIYKKLRPEHNKLITFAMSASVIDDQVPAHSYVQKMHAQVDLHKQFIQNSAGPEAPNLRTPETDFGRLQANIHSRANEDDAISCSSSNTSSTSGTTRNNDLDCYDADSDKPRSVYSDARETPISISGSVSSRRLQSSLSLSEKKSVHSQINARTVGKTLPSTDKDHTFRGTTVQHMSLLNKPQSETDISNFAKSVVLVHKNNIQTPENSYDHDIDSSNDGPYRNDGNNGSSHHLGSITSVQLASLQRAVLGVQNMLSTINENIADTTSRSALVLMKDKLSQQADVLISTVAALNFGVSLASTSQSRSLASRTFYMATTSNSSTGPTSKLGNSDNIFLKMIWKAISSTARLFFGEAGNATKLINSSIRTVARAVSRRIRPLRGLRILMLLVYKHFRVYAMVCWTGAFLIWQANVALIWSNLKSQLTRGIAL